MVRLGLLCCLLAVFYPLNAQRIPLDSLLRMEQSYQQLDTIRAQLLSDISKRYYAIDPRKGVQFAEKAIALSEKLPNKLFLANAYSAMGANNLILADYPKALDFYQKALEINEKLGYLQGVGNNFNNIGLVYYSIFDYPRALEYYQKTLTINEKTGNKASTANCLGNIGAIYNVLQDYPRAIEYFEQALSLSESIGNRQNVAGNLANLGNAYTQLKNYPKALDFKLRALDLYETLGNTPMLVINLGNLANVYTQMGDYSQALQYHEQALAMAQSIKDEKGMASSYASLGNLYFLQKKYEKAAHLEHQALQIAQDNGLLNTASEALRNLAQIYESTGRFDSAFVAFRGHILLRDSVNNVEKQTELTKKTLQFEFSKTEDSLRQFQIITDAKLQQQLLLASKQQQELELKQVAINLANKDKELQHLAYLKSQADLQFEQSLTREQEEKLVLSENQQKLQATQVNLQQTQLELQDKEIEAQKTQRWLYVGGILLLSLLSFFIYRNFLNQKKSTRLIEIEKQKSEALLRNILPDEVADELKENGQAMARLFTDVTVLFTDFVHFTQVSETLSPQQLVGELHLYFNAFDEIMERYDLEKIKTIGDAYMAAAGLPVAQTDHAKRAALAALDIQTFVAKRQKTQPQSFQIRIGLHSGPVVAGIVGSKKFAYDIWGDTVNTAARMESSSEPGRINLSARTFALLEPEFEMEYRGALEAKNKGVVDMYFLNGMK